MRSSLTNSERAIRRSRGIPIWRFLPFLLAFIALLIASGDEQFMQQCLGKPIQGSSRVAGGFRFIVAIFCSPRYLMDFAHHWWVIALFFIGVGLAIQQVIWMRRHRAYWDAVREKETFKRSRKMP